MRLTATAADVQAARELTASRLRAWDVKAPYLRSTTQAEGAPTAPAPASCEWPYFLEATLDVILGELAHRVASRWVRATGPQLWRH
jgi:hypothetical protein